jgi:DNA-binding response OmpR family regulator
MPKVLIVEKEWSISMFYKEMLGEIGIDSVCVYEFKEALYLLSVEKFDLIIFEPVLYGGKHLNYKRGIATLNEIKRRYKKIPIIICSAFGQFSMIKSFESVGLDKDNYVVKNSDTSELLFKIGSLLKIDKKLIAGRYESPNKAVRIFISYAKKDFTKAHAIYTRLMQEKFSPWIDNENLLPGQDWELEIEKAIEECNFFLACLSEYSITKEGFVQKELKKGLEILERQPEGRIYLIPVRLDKCKVTKLFGKLQWCNLFESNGVENLLSSIRMGCQQRDIKINLI